MTATLILGAPDPEMATIERIAREAGVPVEYAMADGRRVHAGNAYRADLPRATQYVAVECGGDGWAPVLVCDHHRPGDPGYGRQPAEFLGASSVGQVVAWLAGAGLLPWPTIPQDVVLCAAADHCLSAAYAGRCPGVDPDDLMRWRVEVRAAFQGRTPAEVLADVEAARRALLWAPRIEWHEDSAWVSFADLRGHVLPELPEAAARNRESYISGPLTAPDGRRKYTASSPHPEYVRAWMDTWAPQYGLVDIYGDPERGFAGGYAS